MTIDLSAVAEGGLGWLSGGGEHADVVLSTRVRLARNLDGIAFTSRAREGERLRVLQMLRDAMPHLPSLQGGLLLRLEDLDQNDRRLLHERHLVSRELAALDGGASKGGSAVFVGQGHGIMVNEEDHLRLQTVRGGLATRAAVDALLAVDREIGARLPYAYHEEFGFLTACPTNTGTGLRASVLIHLPGLVLTKEIGKVLSGLQAMGLTYRGLYGEGSEVIGNFFQISNQTTLGRSEDELVDHLHRVVSHVIKREHDARRVMWREAGYIIEDKLWRAYGTLRFARSLTFEEAMNYLSGVRLAVGLQLITGLSVATLNRLLIFSQPAHLGYAEGRVLGEEEANVARARYVREALGAETDQAKH
ncbi:MAG: protein arginine kinase [Gemmatimonadetes bacterium]|nr:protein arginine kinase [Gemmatimonadota bacterium]